MEDNTVPTVNEQLENLVESPEDSNPVDNETHERLANLDGTVDDVLLEAPAKEDLATPSEDIDSDSSTSTGNLVEEWGYLNKQISWTHCEVQADQLPILGTLGHWL